ncbi:hypothetical protein [Prosthecobacter sp.]|uniref:hypothetical protein n=1 Tax=Prosthecobacter sp. TaxID=1965333 RepID=UPI003783777C
MISKFSVEYTIHPQHNSRRDTHRTDDPVELEDFLMQLLIAGARILSIKHEGVELDQAQSSRILRVAAERIATRLLAASLGLDAAAVKHRFGLAV